jgi:ribosomal protein S18 acetylase RimI-like enzyme
MIRGSCLCGGIRFEISGALGLVAQCHCEACRKAQGSAFAVNTGVARDQFRFTAGEQLLSSFESSPGKYRCFCSVCGSPVYSRRDDAPDVVRPRLGLLDGDIGARPAVHGWTSDKAPWERIPDDGLPRFAAGAPESRIGRVKLRAEEPSSPDAEALIAALDADLAKTYPQEVIFGLHEDDHERIIFLVARRGGRAIGCGGLRSLDPGMGEVKRMYVVPEERGNGLSRILLRAIETIAIGKRHRVLRLETGKLSPAALALYRSSGYREIAPYGEYAGNDYSVCFEKKI